jgi:hypothetical protein
MMPRDLLPIILTGSLWSTGLEIYDFFQYIELKPDGTGVMGHGANHALVLVIAYFSYEYVNRETLLLEFFDTTHRTWGELFRRTEENAFRQVGIQLTEGIFLQREPFGGPIPFLYQLKFDQEPFPIGYQPRTTRLQYHGWPTTYPLHSDIGKSSPPSG